MRTPKTKTHAEPSRYQLEQELAKVPRVVAQKELPGAEDEEGISC